MTDRAPPPTVHVPGPPVHGALAPAALRALAPADLARWVVSRRWFGAKGRPPVDARITEVIPLAWEGDRAVVTRLDVTDAAGTTQSYQLPLVARVGEPADPAARSAVLAYIDAGGERGVLLDAIEDPGFRARLGEAFGAGAAFEGDGARWTVRPLGEGAPDLSGVPSEVGRAEQSNTSVRYGDRAMLKLFRRLEHGENPDVEIGEFLTTETRFRHVPPVLAVLRYRDATGATYVTGMVSRFIPHAHDGWALALGAVRAALAPNARDDAGREFAAESERVGRVTRALHAALASNPETPGFRCDPITAGDIERWAAAARTAIGSGLSLLGDRADTLAPPHRPMARAIAGRGPALAEQVDDVAAQARRALAGAARSSAPTKTRHHGDYHLGQLLRSGDGQWFIVDFEGEPSRPLAERRALTSPLRDVAGMLRSFAYAAATGAAAAGGLGVDPRTEIRAAHWERDVRAGFLRGYGASDDDPLIHLFEMEKTFYELSYELNNRPEWVWIPLRGIARMF